MEYVSYSEYSLFPAFEMLIIVCGSFVAAMLIALADYLAMKRRPYTKRWRLWLIIMPVTLASLAWYVYAFDIKDVPWSAVLLSFVAISLTVLTFILTSGTEERGSPTAAAKHRLDAVGESNQVGPTSGPVSEILVKKERGSMKEEIRLVGSEALVYGFIEYVDGFSGFLSVQSQPLAEKIAEAADLVKEGRYDEADAKAAKIISSAETASEQPILLLSQANLIGGDAAFGRGLFPEAQRYYDLSQQLAVLIKDDFLLTASAQGVAIVEGSLGKHAEALKIFDEILDSHPDRVSAWTNKAAALNNLGKYEQALAACDEAIQRNAKNATAWNNKGVAFGNLGKHEDALIAFEKATQLNRKDASAWTNKAAALNNLGKYEQALAACDEAYNTIRKTRLLGNSKHTLFRHFADITRPALQHITPRTWIETIRAHNEWDDFTTH